MYGFGDNLDRGDSFSDFLHQPSMHFNGYKNSSFNMYNSDVVFSMNYDFRNSDSGLIDSYISDLHFTVPIDKGFFSLGFSPKTFSFIVNFDSTSILFPLNLWTLLTVIESLKL